ncbi:radical SAM protein [Patescibacteria group bacterium]|nr:radical SAM protein [Patescibacteria group bacterium]
MKRKSIKNVEREKSIKKKLPLKATPIIKIVGDYCNLRCHYCFFHNNPQSMPRIMSDALLEKFLKEYMDAFNGKITFHWHGGEPLLAGVTFFQKIIDIQSEFLKKGQLIRNTVQTNGTLINDEWAEFFKTNDFGVGVSLDGFKESHNRFRKNSRGQGSFDRVIRGIKILQKHSIRSGIIQTFTHDNISNVKKDFNFLINKLGIKSVGLNPYLDLKKTNKLMPGQNVTNQDLINFFETYIDLWLTQNDQNLQIREIDNFICGVLKKKSRNCSFKGSCANFFCLEYDGRIYSSCERLSGNPNLLIGNLSRQPLLEILNNSKRLEIIEEMAFTHPDCQICEWKDSCNNGCTYHRIGGIRGKYYFCEGRKVIFSYLKKILAKRQKLI